MPIEPENNFAHGKSVEPKPEKSESQDLEELAYGDIEPDPQPAQVPSHGFDQGEKRIVEEVDLQDNYVENKEPAELWFCIILSSMYIGLAKYFWEPLQKHSWLFINFEAFLVFIGVVSLLLGIRPYVSPSSLQISKHGIKYRGPYWPQRKTVNWSLVVQMYVSPELILVIYRLPNKPKSIRPLLIHSVYLADKEKIADSIIKYSPVEPILVANPGIATRTMQILMFAAVVIWIFNVLRS